MREYKKETIFDLLQDKTYNIFFDEIQDPEEGLYWSAKNGDFMAIKAYLEINNPAEWDSKSKEYKERMRQNEPIPILIDKEEYKKLYPVEYKELYRDEEE